MSLAVSFRLFGMRAFTSGLLAFCGVAAVLTGAATAGEACVAKKSEASRARSSRIALVSVATKPPASLAGSFRPFSIEFPDQVDPKSFTNRATVDIEILPNGTVGKVKLVKSTGVAAVDEQVQEGVKGWRFGKTKEKLFLYLTLVIEIR